MRGTFPVLVAVVKDQGPFGGELDCVLGSGDGGSHVLEGGEGGWGGVRRGGGEGGLAGTPLLLGCPAKKWEKSFFFPAEDGNGTQKNENLWDIITSKNMPPVGFDTTTYRPVVHCSTTHLSHRNA